MTFCLPCCEALLPAAPAPTIPACGVEYLPPVPTTELGPELALLEDKVKVRGRRGAERGKEGFGRMKLVDFEFVVGPGL